MLNFPEIMNGLSRVRPVFHSEADFQHALAWHIHRAVPDCGVRLEYRPFPEKSLYLDLWLGGIGMGLELKYVTCELDYEQDGETFRLKNQSAQDTRRYDFLRDVERLERVVHEAQADRGLAVLLTNDAAYWKEPRSKTTNDSEFQLYEGRRVRGKMNWSVRAAPGTKKGRENPIELEGSYRLHWKEYSTAGEKRNGVFRYLAVEVGGEENSRVASSGI